MVFSIAGGISIPVLTSFIALGETPSVWKLLCFAVIFIGAYFVTRKPSEIGGIKNKKIFFFSVFSLAVVNGIYGGLINLQQAYTGEGQKDEMLTYTFLIAGIFSFIFLLIKKKGEAFKSFKQTRSSFLFMLGAALSSGFAINMLIIIAKYIDVNLLWTFNNSGVLVLSVIASAIIFKEKLTATNIAACAVIALTLVAVSLV
jgi:drug/metabolite transporter (DMT)-like permease